MRAAAAGVAVAAAIGWVDFLRPAERRSHFGRFVGTALDGGALGTIERKAAASLDLLLLGPHTLAAAALTVLLALVLVRPPPLFAPPAASIRAWARCGWPRPCSRAWAWR